MSIKLGIVMDPIQTIHPKKDSSLAMLLEAQARGWQLQYMEMDGLKLADGLPVGHMRPVEARDDPNNWFTLGEETERPLTDLDVILMRKDPPFDMEYVYATYLLEQAAARGTLVVNHPRALRDANEKLFTAWFPECTPPTLVGRRHADLLDFLEQHRDIILKPLGGMGGASIFRLQKGDPNTQVILETMTAHQSRYVMAQRFLPEISEGDKRILVIDGEPVPWALARIPRPGETRGNLAAGGTGKGVPLSERDRWIAKQVAPRLRQAGILFAGLDVIGDNLTEINVTSPTCIRELDRLYGINIAGQLMDSIEQKLRA